MIEICFIAINAIPILWPVQFIYFLVTSAKVEKRERNGREHLCEWQTIFRDYFPNTLSLFLHCFCSFTC